MFYCRVDLCFHDFAADRFVEGGDVCYRDNVCHFLTIKSLEVN